MPRGPTSSLMAEEPGRSSFTWLRQINQFIDLQEAKNQEIGKETTALAGKLHHSSPSLLTLSALALGPRWPGSSGAR